MNKKQEKVLEEIAEIRANVEIFKWTGLVGLDAIVDDEAEKLIRDRIWDFIEVDKWK